MQPLDEIHNPELLEIIEIISMVYEKFEMPIEVEGVSEEDLLYVVHCLELNHAKIDKVDKLPSTIEYTLNRKPVTINRLSEEPDDYRFEIRVPMKYEEPETAMVKEEKDSIFIIFNPLESPGFA